jgi:tetratricopeptide (TPR) repeat protein
MTWRLRSIIVGLGIAVPGLGSLASPAAAQLARLPASPDAPKLLVAPFGRDQAGDSALAITVGDAVRARMLDAHTDAFQTITRKAVCDFLEESGFTCSTQLEPSQVGQLAHVMNARYMVDGMIFPRGTDSVLVLARMLQNVRQNPLATSVSAVVSRDKVNSSVGNTLADRLADKFRSFQYITNCRAALDAKDYSKATDEVNRALRYDHESAGAYLCLAQIAQAKGEPTDSVQAALERAHDADSLNTIVGRQLYIIYQDKHDTAQMLHMLRHIMQVDLNDVDIRKVAVEIQVRRGHPDSAVTILDEALRRNPNQFDLQVLKAISLAAEGKFEDAGATMDTAATVDSTKVDSLFLARTLAFYDAAKDSAASFRWRRICTVRTPNDADCWFLYASGLYDHHDTAGAIAAMHHVVTLRPGAGRGQIALASWYGTAGQTDSSLAYADAAVAADSTWRAQSAAAVDSARHRPPADTVAAIDSTFRAHLPAGADSGWSPRPAAAAIYLRAGNEAFQAKDYPKAITLLTQAQPWAVGQTQVTLSYLLGISQFNIGLVALQTLQAHPAMKTNHPSAAQVTEACGLVKTINDNFTPAQANMGAGASLNRDVANQILTYIGNVVPALGQIKTRLKCP